MNKDLVDEIKSRMFLFEDIVNLNRVLSREFSRTSRSLIWFWPQG
jgi:flagellar motor switch protein FliG